MASLFIDTTYDITIGILDSDLRWLSFDKFSGQKSSSVLQKETNQMLSRLNLEASNLNNVFTISGPGFYTGLRLSEGVADVFSFIGVKNYSFYSYLIPGFLDVASGVWMTKAYRGEYFFYVWNNDISYVKLISSAELGEFVRSMADRKFFCHSDSALDDVCRKVLPHMEPTHQLLKSSSREIFGRVLAQNLKSDTYYFRAPEDEFRVSK